MKNVTAIGEILFDVYPEGKKIGGAPFNFIYHVIKLTGKGNFVSSLGDDEPGRQIRQFLAERKISAEYIQTDKSHATGAARTTLNEKKIPEFIIEENRAYDFIEPVPELDDLISGKTDCLYFGSLAQRNEISRETIQNYFNSKIKRFCDLNIRQHYYSAGLIEESLKAADVLKLNEDELRLVSEIFMNDVIDSGEAARKLADLFKIELLCVTKGNDGAVIFKGEEENFCRVSSDNVVDTVGAGDAYASLLCIGYLNGWEIKRINRLASEFAAEIVKVEGALPNDDHIYELFKRKIRNEDG